MTISTYRVRVSHNFIWTDLFLPNFANNSTMRHERIPFILQLAEEKRRLNSKSHKTDGAYFVGVGVVVAAAAVVPLQIDC